MESVFTRVREALVNSASEVLREFGVHRPKGDHPLDSEWNTGYKCPLCPDQGGSASFTRELYLRCHQCGFKGDVFTWMSKQRGGTAWDICKQLADRLKLNITPKHNWSKKQTGMPSRMTEELLRRSIHDLWDSEGAAQSRKVLAERGLDDQVLLAELGVGWVNGYITFSQRGLDGTLQDKYRAWSPNGNPKWLWCGKGIGGPGIWPGWRPLQEKDRVLLLEGESDTLAALIRLRLQDEGWFPCTWTAGATSCPHPRDVPRAFSGRELHILYDNDVFQGPDYGDYFVQAKGANVEAARTAAVQRLKNLLNNVGPLFASLNCKVVIRQCPIDPRDKYGGDFRDWVERGGHDLVDWKEFPLEDLPPYGTQAVEIGYDEVFTHVHQMVKVKMQVDSVRADDVLIPKTSRLECPMGTVTACQNCSAPKLFPDRIIDWSKYQRELAMAFAQSTRTAQDYLMQAVLQKPRNCPRAELVTQDVKLGSDWHGIKSSVNNQEESAQRRLRIISEEQPSLSGEVEVCGTIYPDHKAEAILVATSVRSMDRYEVDLADVSVDLELHCPGTDDPDKIDIYLDERWRDLAFNVTKIHGRRDIQVAHDLLAHSVIDMRVEGAKQRGWLDICVFGETRSGKSLTFRRMFEHHEMGIYHAAVGNVSRAGLIMGSNKHGQCVPGLMPRSHRKMLVLDEWHFLCQNYMMEHPMSWLQSARDEGRSSGIKIYGNRDLPSKVRFATIANWLNGGKDSFEFGCEHVLALYGAVETMSRMDFCLAVDPLPTQETLDEAEHFWNREMTRATIMRAWAQDYDDVLLDSGVVECALRHVQSWKDVYHHESMPLYTPEEKIYSVLRIAVAIANLCYSHPKDDNLKVLVKIGHVNWAARWLKHTWTICQYDLYSKAKFDRESIKKPFDAERSITVTLALDDSEAAQSVFSLMMKSFTIQELMAVSGQDSFTATKWLARMQALKVFKSMRGKTNTAEFITTKGGRQVISNLMKLASEEPAIYIDRYRRMQSLAGTHNLAPIDSQYWELVSAAASENGNVIPIKNHEPDRT